MVAGVRYDDSIAVIHAAMGTGNTRGAQQKQGEQSKKFKQASQAPAPWESTFVVKNNAPYQ
ncbi:MAG TPA: hypothetical protein VHE81_04355 [Lacipirellulaceae bacterium]|jgi:hypothetical protein|nr:hypothetical protein [Lacipirellulaceae bacterium]